MDVGGGERLGGVGVEREPRAFGDSHAAGDGQAAGLAAEVLGVDALELDRGELGAIDDLEVQIADAVVAADDIEVHVADDVFEFVAEELIVFAARGRFADAGERIAAAAAVGEAVADFDFVRDVVAVGAGVDEQFEVVVLGEFVDALAGGARREADDFQVDAAGPRGFAERDSLEPEAEDVAREDCEDDERSDERDGCGNRSNERAAVEQIVRIDGGDCGAGGLVGFGDEIGVVGGGVRGDGCDIDGGDDVILQRGKRRSRSTAAVVSEIGTNMRRSR